jgi:MoxR-like ATPase
MAGTYPLPEAQLDRFFFKLLVDYPDSEALLAIARLNAGTPVDEVPVAKVLSKDRILEIRNSLAQIPITDRIYDLVVELVQRTHPGYEAAPSNTEKYVKYGASPRGVNAVLAASRLTAVMDGRVNLAIDDVEANYIPALRHRLVMKFESEVEGIRAETVLREIFAQLKKSF